MKKTFFLIFLFLTTTLFASRDFHFVCEGDDSHYEFFISVDSNPEVRLHHVKADSSDTNYDEGKLMLKRSSKVGFHYSLNNIDIIVLLDHAIVYNSKTKESNTCQIETGHGLDHSEITNPKHDIKKNTTMFSLGGNVRSAPSIKNKKVDSIPKMTVIYDYENTDIIFDGYPWFYIEYGVDKSGFQWGGIMCNKDKDIKGVYHSCE